MTDDELLAQVVRETRRVRAVRLAASCLPGLVLGFASAKVGVALAAIGLVWQWWTLGLLPGGRLSVFDGRHPLTHMTFSGEWVYTTIRGRRVRFFGSTAATTEFRDVLKRRFPDAPQLVAVLPIAPRS